MVSNIFILDEHLKTQKVLAINGRHTFFNDLYKLDLSTGAESYEFSTNACDIEESYYVMFLYKGVYKLFQIIEIEQEHSEGNIITTVYTESACLELINGVVRPYKADNVRCIDFFEHILSGTDWVIGECSSTIEDKAIPVDIDKTTQIWSVIQDYMSEFGYEISSRVIYESGYVKAKVIDIYATEELGNKTYKRFEYGRNTKGIIKKKDLYDFCTALILETKLDLANEGELTKGEYIKPAGSDVILAPNENILYNYGKDYIYGVYEDGDSVSAAEVVEKAVEELKRRATPKFDYEVDTALTYREYEEVSLGDVVYVVDHTFKPRITLEARIGELNISFTDRNNCSCVLTNYKEVKNKVKNSYSIVNEIKDYINNIEVGLLSKTALDQLILYLKQLSYEYEEITAIVNELEAIAQEMANKERDKVSGEYVDILVNDSRRNYVCSTVRSMKFRLPTEAPSADFSTVIEFTTEKHTDPTKFYQSTLIWLDGDDCINGALVPNADTKYTITIWVEETYSRIYKGQVTKESYGGSYKAYVNKTDYVDKVSECMKTYYDNRDKFKYNTTTIYSFKDPTTEENRAKWQTDGKYHIDCSTFCQLVTRGITYVNSTYNKPDKSPYYLSTKYQYSFVLDASITDRDRFASDQARACIENGWQLGYDMSKQENWQYLQTGDIVFWSKRVGESSAEINERYMQVGHVAIVNTVKVNPNTNLIDATTYEATSHENTILNRYLSNNYPEKILFVARPRR